MQSGCLLPSNQTGLTTISGMAKMTRKEQQEHNRGLLLEAAERIFGSRGIAGASLDDVAKEAGLTKGAVFSNFKNKTELVLEVIRNRQTSAAEVQEFDRILEEPDDHERLRAWCAHWVETARRGDRFMYARLMFDFLPYALREPELGAQLLELIAPASDGPSPIPADSPFAALPMHDQERIVMALDIGLSALHLLDPDGTDPALYTTAVMALTHTNYAPTPEEELG